MCFRFFFWSYITYYMMIVAYRDTFLECGIKISALVVLGQQHTMVRPLLSVLDFVYHGILHQCDFTTWLD